MSSMRDTTRNKIEALKRAYAEQLPARVEAMEKIWAGLGNRDGDGERLVELARQAHGLAGSGATYGFAVISKTARELELMIEATIEAGGNFDSRRAQKIEILLAALRRASTLAGNPSDEIIK